MRRKKGGRMSFIFGRFSRMKNASWALASIYSCPAQAFYIGSWSVYRNNMQIYEAIIQILLIYIWLSIATGGDFIEFAQVLRKHSIDEVNLLFYHSIFRTQDAINKINRAKRKKFSFSFTDFSFLLMMINLWIAFWCSLFTPSLSIRLYIENE